MISPPGERKALVFSVGPVRLALRLTQVLEILAAEAQGGEVLVRGEKLPALPLAVALGLPPGPAGFALVIASPSRTALCVDSVGGIVDLSGAEVFQLPSRTLLPQPPPFQAAIVAAGEVALELAVSTLGWAPIEPAADVPGPPPELDVPPERELLFARGGRTFAVPLPLLVRVLEATRIFPVPLAPPSHLGLAYHQRAIHPVIDPAVLYGDPPPAAAPGGVLLVDAGGAQVGLAADEILHASPPPGTPVLRPSWDALFAG